MGRAGVRTGGDGRALPSGLWVHESGEGPLVVLVHGAMDRAGGMLRVRRFLHREFRVVRYDRRGYGRSRGAPVGDFGLQVADLADVLAGRPAVVAGHSYGGVVALALAQAAPHLVRAVAAYEAPMIWEPWWPHRASVAGDQRPEEAAEWFLRRMIGDAAWERLPPAMQRDRRAEGPALIADLRSLRPPAPPPYAPEAIRVPVVAAHGGAARPHHRRAAEELARRVPGAELMVLPGATHGAHLTHPEAFAGLVRRAIALAATAAAPGEGAGGARSL